MRDYQLVNKLSDCLIKAVGERDGSGMQKAIDALECAYKSEFGDSIDGYEALHAFVLMNLASTRYFAFNNMYGMVHARYDDVARRMYGIRASGAFTAEQHASPFLMKRSGVFRMTKMPMMKTTRSQWMGFLKS